MSGNGALAQDLPASRAQRKVNNGGGQGMSGGATVDDERNAIADLIASDSGGCQALTEAPDGLSAFVLQGDSRLSPKPGEAITFQAIAYSSRASRLDREALLGDWR